jgi:hypothetical protein
MSNLTAALPHPTAALPHLQERLAHSSKSIQWNLDRVNFLASCRVEVHRSTARNGSNTTHKYGLKPYKSPQRRVKHHKHKWHNDLSRCSARHQGLPKSTLLRFAAKAWAFQHYLVLKSRGLALEVRGDFTRCKRWLQTSWGCHKLGKLTERRSSRLRAKLQE